MAKHLAGFVLAILLIISVCTVALFGAGPLDGILDEGGVRKGLDLVGGSVIVYEADLEEEMSADELAFNMQAVQNMMVNRLTALGYTEATATLSGDRRIRIEIPSIDDPEEASQLLGSMARLEFKDSDGNVVLEGKDIKTAYPQYGDATGQGIPQFFVALEFKPDAVDKFEAATRAVTTEEHIRNRTNYIAIVLDGEELSTPFVEQPMRTESCTITGNFDRVRAVWLASIITSGQLPFALKEVQLEAIGPTLGEEALQTSVIAGAIGIFLVMVFMTAFYRLPGLMASIALCGYIGIVGVIICVTKVNLSLPGIAGIILSVGMAVDANVIIFERIKEELRAGKSTVAAFRAGFKNAFTSIIDSNVTTLIAVVVLLVFGTGSIVGFAQTLLIGVLVSMFTALAVTRGFLTCLIGMRVTNPKKWGMRKKDMQIREEATRR